MFESLNLLQFLYTLDASISLSNLHEALEINKNDLGVRLSRLTNQGLVNATDKKPRLYSISENGKLYTEKNIPYNDLHPISDAGH